MPTTSPDNIVYPSLADQGDDLPAVFATMASSIQDAFDDVHDDVDALSAATTITQATFGTAASGVTVGFFGMRRIGKHISGSLRVTRAAGLVHGEPVFTVNTAYRPAMGELLPLPNVTSGGTGNIAAGGGAALNSSGQIIVFSPGTRTTLEVALSWIIP